MATVTPSKLLQVVGLVGAAGGVATGSVEIAGLSLIIAGIGSALE